MLHSIGYIWSPIAGLGLPSSMKHGMTLRTARPRDKDAV